MKNQLDHIKSLFALRKINRREFISNAIVMGLSAPMAASLISETVHAAEPKKGGVFRVALAGGATTDSLDPATYADTFMQMIGMGMCFNCLTEISATGELVPELAESWEASSDASEWTFSLRKSVTFHNGKIFGSDDVIATIQHHLKPDSKSYAKTIVNVIEDVKADGPNRVVFKLKSGNASFPYLLSDYHLTIFPAGVKDAFIKGIGTGGYVLDQFDPGVRANASRNPNYFKSDRAYFDSVQLIGVADSTARNSALLNGEVDAINRVSLNTLHLLKRNQDIQIIEVTGNQHFTFPMNTTREPFNNNDVRMALKFAIDRDALVQKILLGHGLVANDHPIGPANRYFAKDLPVRSYDPDKARFHLKKAGLSSLSVNLSASDGAFSGAVNAGLLYADSARNAGIEINVVREPKDGYWSNVWMKKPWCASYWSGRATEDWMFTQAYSKGSNANETYWDHPRFNKILVEARAQLDDAKRGEMYHELQRIVRDEGGTVIPMYANYVDAGSTKLGHADNIGNAWQMDGARMAERWWFN